MIGSALHVLRELDGAVARMLSTHPPTRAEKVLAALGHTLFCVLVLAGTEVCLLIWGGEQGATVAVISMLSIGLTFLFSQVTKLIVIRLRPSDVLPELVPLVRAPDKYSFPSSHAAGTFCIAMSISVFYRGIIPLVFLIALTISLSRVIARLHYPSDVFVGATIGMLIGGATSLVGRYLVLP